MYAALIELFATLQLQGFNQHACVPKSGNDYRLSLLGPTYFVETLHSQWPSSQQNLPTKPILVCCTQTSLLNELSGIIFLYLEFFFQNIIYSNRIKCELTCLVITKIISKTNEETPYLFCRFFNSDRYISALCLYSFISFMAPGVFAYFTLACSVPRPVRTTFAATISTLIMLCTL